MSDLPSFIAQYQARSTSQLLETLTKCEQQHASETGANRLFDAMRYSLANGGKRVRPILVYATAHAVAAINNNTDTFASAIECIHAYSLIHDDLPAMDDDNLRRGKPTCHIAFDEATAILAGDALHTLAFELISSSVTVAQDSAATALSAISLLSRASGAHGMVLGQAIDLAAVDKPLKAEQLELMHRYKTGALIEAAVLLGALSAAASNEQTAALRNYAAAVGLAFQVQDDIIDVTSDTEVLGKQQGADADRNKPTYVSLLGLAQAQAKADELRDIALAALTPFDSKADYLRDLARYIVSRNS
jgi:farnesyl-diphosphate synthase (EC 2.5.1.10)